MYRQLTTVIVIRKLGADPTKATALWNEIAKLSDRKLRLPYDDPSEPWMLYLNFNAQSAAIARDLAERVGDKWRAMNERLDAVKPADKRKAVAQELKAYRADIESFLDKASKAFNKDVAPLATAITADVNDHRKKIPKDAEVIEGGTPTPGWQFPADRYRAELDRTEKVLDKSLDLSKLDPDEFFPEDAFPTDVQ